METLVTVFIIVAAVAIVIQMGVLIAMYASMNKTSQRVNAVADIVEKKGLPLLENLSELVTTNAPKVNTIIENASVASSAARVQIERLDATVSDIVDRTRLHVIRADELISRTMDRVEETTDIVHHSVISPVKALAGIVSGVTATASLVFGGGKRRRRPARNGGSEDEMFI